MAIPHPLLNGISSSNGDVHPESPPHTDHTEPPPSAPKLSQEQIADILQNQYPVDDVVPPEHWGRTLVLCFDGTGDQFDEDNSNIVEFFRLLKKDDRKKQMVYYQAGIGTYTSPTMVTPMAARVSKTLDAAIAWNLHSHVMDGYEFLMQNYTVGDRICIFGFSRGAYTARSLAGMIHKVGILPACNHQQVPFAYKMYIDEDTDANNKQALEFKATFSTDVDIEFVGVWDTVDSVGLIPRRLPLTGANDIIRTFRHALALDEHRAKFKANHFHRNAKEDEEEALHNHLHVDSSIRLKQKKNRKGKGLKGLSKEEKGLTLQALKQKYSKKRRTETDIKEVWFAGCHCDVGGGSVRNEVKPNLARIPLRWMIRECFAANSGIMFHTKGLEDLGMDVDCLYPIVQPRPAERTVDPCDHCVRVDPPKPALSVFSRMFSWIFRGNGYDQVPNGKHHHADSDMADLEEEDLELGDALSPAYDQLDISWFWWILEYLPLLQMSQGECWKHLSRFKANWGQGRHIPLGENGRVMVHRSVKMRMEAAYEGQTERYQPVAKNFAELQEQKLIDWVD
ncbi:hypothetical protein VNI00_012263 [Paramarasmius palmivorus]|uniref:T6SS Phospholipase effector Tle1-like catalytic domain-containing protein n=1 Tax=Paramarasmius palmivorus TaxID=297713 RepID=A0AAW0C8C6_9AGAR